MTDFSLNFIARWKNGAYPLTDDAPHGALIVNYDKTNSLYGKPDDYDRFIEWVSENWGGDTNCRLMGDDGEFLETAQQHLDRIDCSICEVQS